MDLLDGITLASSMLFVLGFVLLGIEMLHPGISIPGVLGVVSLGVGIIISADSVEEGLVFILIIVVVLGIMLAIILNVLSKGKLKFPIILEEEQNRTYQSSKNMEYLKGAVGEATTDLRPSGKAIFGDEEYSVITDGKYITIGKKVKVYEIKGSDILVKPI